MRNTRNLSKNVKKLVTYISQNFVFFKCVIAFLHLPYTQVLCGCRQYVFARSFDIRNPHYLCWWEFMLELIDFPKSIVRLAKIEVNNVDLVIHRVSVVGPYRHLKLIIFARSKCNGIIIKVTLVCVDLLGEAVVRQMIDFIFNILHLA